MSDIHPLLVFLSRFPVSDRLFNIMMFAYVHRYIPNLKNPSALNEKIQWLKINLDYSDFEKYTDKISARELVGKMIGEEYLIKLLGIYKTADEIKFESLPQKFVLKTNHGCGWNIICTDQNNFDSIKAKDQLSTWLRYNYYKIMHEPTYKSIPPKIICEEYLEEENAIHTFDYKFYCFDGKIEFIVTNVDRFTNHSQFITDKNWNPLPFSWGFKKYNGLLEKPNQLDEMLSIAETLSKIHKFIRVDLYCIKGKIYFSELTFFPLSGFCKILPIEWDHFWGAKLEL